MKVRLHIDKATAVKHGVEKYGYGVADVPLATLTQPQRDLLATFVTPHKPENPAADCYIDSAGDYDWSTRKRFSVLSTVIAADAATVVRVLDAILAYDAAVAAEAAAQKAAEEAKEAAALAECLAVPEAEWQSQFLCREYSEWRLQRVSPLHTASAPKAKAMLAKLEALRDRLRESDKVRAEAEKARKDAMAAAVANAKRQGHTVIGDWIDSATADELPESITFDEILDARARRKFAFEWVSYAENLYLRRQLGVLGRSGCQVSDEFGDAVDNPSALAVTMVELAVNYLQATTPTVYDSVDVVRGREAAYEAFATYEASVDDADDVDNSNDTSGYMWFIRIAISLPTGDYGYWCTPVNHRNHDGWRADIAKTATKLPQTRRIDLELPQGLE